MQGRVPSEVGNRWIRRLLYHRPICNRVWNQRHEDWKISTSIVVLVGVDAPRCRPPQLGPRKYERSLDGRLLYVRRSWCRYPPGCDVLSHPRAYSVIPQHKCDWALYVPAVSVPGISSIYYLKLRRIYLFP